MWAWLPRQIPECEVILYTRQGCHLCEDAHAILERVRQRFGFTLRVVDIDPDPELIRLYGEQVPVVTVDGQVRFRGQVNEVLLTRLLRARR
jgi:glutaredoxin